MTATGDLRGIGIVPGQRVRFRTPGGGQWREGRASAIEKDGSIGVVDAKGSSRAIPMERIEVRTSGPRGAPRWEPMTEVAARVEQLGLF
jgi:hypothetical protein